MDTGAKLMIKFLKTNFRYFFIYSGDSRGKCKNARPVIGKGKMISLTVKCIGIQHISDIAQKNEAGDKVGLPARLYDADFRQSRLCAWDHAENADRAGNRRRLGKNYVGG